MSSQGLRQAHSALKRWRDLYAVHPVADLFPTMSEDELRELGEDIKQNGLQHPIILWCDRTPQLELRVRDGISVLDGRNRLDAMELVGLPTFANKTGKFVEPRSDGTVGTTGRFTVARYAPTHDPLTIVVTENVRRRHLTREQKREVIERLLKGAPEKSDRQIATAVGVAHKTVGDVRRQSEASGEIPQSTERVGSDGRTRIYEAIAARTPYVATEDEAAAAAEQAAIDEARHHATEPYGIPPRRPEHVKAMYSPMKEKPHPKGLAASHTPWVTECPCCGYDLYGWRGEDDEEVTGWLAASVAPMPERVA